MIIQPKVRLYRPSIYDIIAITGASGSGKGEVAKKIIAAVGEEYVGHNELDNFYLDRSDMPPEEREKLDFDDPNNSLDWFEVIHFVMCLKEGKPVEMPLYDFDSHTRVTRPEPLIITPKRFNLIDSHMALWHPKLRTLYRKKLFVDPTLDICGFRRQDRDTRPKEEGGRGRTNESVRKQWPKVSRAFKIHFEPTKEFANIIIPEGGNNEEGIDFIIGWMKYQIMIEAQQTQTA
ncbi:MAG: uridine kinase [Patescibacteria group bacterium]